MKDFPQFMKSTENRIDSTQQSTGNIEGYYYEGADSGQVAFWTYHSDKISKEHTHEFDEYCVCVDGQCIAYIDGVEFVLNPGNEVLVSKGVAHWEKCIAGTRMIYAFGGKRIMK